MHTHDALQRRNRYRPSSTGKRVTLKDRDLQWLVLIARHGPLPSHFLHAATAASFPNTKAARMRLTDLVSETNTLHGGAYLERPPMQRGIENARNRSLIYDLSDKGWLALGLRRADIVRANGPFRHQVMVACVTASIEIACMARDDVDYIPADRFLPDADCLGIDLMIANLVSGNQERHRLVPDQLFALAYHSQQGTTYRAYCVEGDRATEPITSPSLARKSYLKSYLQYRTLVSTGLYQDRFGLKCPLMVLNVMSNQGRAQRFQELVQRHSANGNAYMLFRTIPEFAESTAPSNVLNDLLSAPWERADQPPISLLA